MTFPGFSSVQDNGTGGAWNPPVNPRLGGSGDASFVEVALGLIGPSASPTGSMDTSPATATSVDNKTGTIPASTARIATAAPNSTPVDTNTAQAPVSMAPVTLTPSQTQSMFSSVLTPAQYLENAMAEIQAGSPTSSDTPMTVAEVLQQLLINNYSTPQNPYAECSDPAAAAALIARIAGPNADVMVPTVAGMTAAYIPATPAGWVGNYTVGYATQSSEFNDAAETFNA
jgi:hypothetical protein